MHTIKKYGPDRVAGFSPIPAMSMVSHASGARFVNLIGGSMLSFYDWYADLPVASPQVFGDQTDVPESGDWWNAGYLIMWGSNLPVTRTPDAHWMTEARYRGQKVIAVAPDYADNVKFADEWLPAKPGTDAALAMAMGHVVLKEFFVDRETPYFTEYVKTYTDLPYLVKLDEAADGQLHRGQVPDCLRPRRDQRRPRRTPPSRPSSSTRAPANPSCPTARWATATATPGSASGTSSSATSTRSSRCSTARRRPCWSGCRASTPPTAPPPTCRAASRSAASTATWSRPSSTCCSRSTASAATGCRGSGPPGYDDAESPYTPAWQEAITGVPASTAARIGREFAANAEESKGRSMIVMGAGTNHWFHSDTIYRAFLTLTNLTGCQGVNGGGWAHYVGQEKVRPITGYTQIANALDWNRPPRNMIQTAYWYLHTNQFRYDQFGADTLSADHRHGPAGRQVHGRRDRPERPDGLDAVVPHVRPQPARRSATTRPPRASRWPSTSSSSSSPASWTSPARTRTRPRTTRASCRSGGPTCSGSSGKGNEYFLKHLLGTDSSLRATETPRGQRPVDVTWRDEAPEGKLDLLMTIDFRQTSTTIFSDVVLPAATWYEKHDLNTTDMHPFVHSFNPAIAPPWQTRTDWDAWQTHRREVQRARGHPPRRAQGRRGGAAHARHPGRDGQPARRRPRLEEGRVRADSRRHDAQAGRGRA